MTGQANVGVSVATDTPEIVVIDGTPRFDPAGPPVSSGGARRSGDASVRTAAGHDRSRQTLAPVSVAVQDGFGTTLINLPPTAVTIAIANNPGGATLGGTVTVNTVQGVATFSNLTLNQIGTGYTLRASAPNVPAAISAPFNIVVAANQLVFTVQPTSTPRALTIAPPIQVAVRDATGNPTTSTAPVQVQILNNPGGGVLTGTTTVAAVNGVATFGNLAITLPGVGYTLQATSRGVDAGDLAAVRHRRAAADGVRVGVEHRFCVVRIRSHEGRRRDGDHHRHRHFWTGYASAAVLE